MAINSFGFIQSDIYFITPPETVIWAKIAYVGFFIATTEFSFGVENIIPYRTFHLPSIILLVMGVVALIVPRESMIYAAYVGYIVMAGVLAIFIVFCTRSTAGEVKNNIRQITIALIVGIVGYIGKSDVVYYNLGETAYLLAGATLVISLIVFELSVIATQALNELDWEKYLMELYIL